LKHLKAKVSQSTNPCDNVFGPKAGKHLLKFHANLEDNLEVPKA